MRTNVGASRRRGRRGPGAQRATRPARRTGSPHRGSGDSRPSRRRPPATPAAAASPPGPRAPSIRPNAAAGVSSGSIECAAIPANRPVRGSPPKRVAGRRRAPGAPRGRNRAIGSGCARAPRAARGGRPATPSRRAAKGAHQLPVPAAVEPQRAPSPPPSATPPRFRRRDGWASAPAGRSTRAPCSSSGSVGRRASDASGWTAEQTSWTKPGSVAGRPDAAADRLRPSRTGPNGRPAPAQSPRRARSGRSRRRSRRSRSQAKFP